MFKVGDEVTVSYGPTQYGMHKKLVVKKLFKQYLELDDGSKWNFNGLPRGSKPNYVFCRRRLVLWDRKHEEANLRFEVVYSFDKQKDELTFEQLQQIWLIIGPVREKDDG